MKLVLLAAAAALAACGSSASTSPTAMPTHFPNGEVRLAFTLDLPAGKPPFPAVVLGHGSGRMTRDQLRWLSSGFVRLGFAVLRFDKRGVGESTGTFVFVGTSDSPDVFPQLASDIAAGVRFLRTRPEIDPRRIGLAGNSQAGWLLPHAARDLGGDVLFLVLHSGPVCTVGQEMYYSNLVEQDTTRSIGEANALMPQFQGPHGYDPVPVLQALDVPALWLLGLDDRSIPIQVTLDNLSALKAAGRPFEWRTYPGLGHGLGPAIWDDIGPWVSTRAALNPSKGQ
jgi:pimeloyl-ACP methyl ester carboxylesterase